MNWARVGPICIGVACALVIIAHTPAILVEPIQKAVAQVRWNTFATDKAELSALAPSETTEQETVTSAKKTSK